MGTCRLMDVSIVTGIDEAALRSVLSGEAHLVVRVPSAPLSLDLVCGSRLSSEPLHYIMALSSHPPAF